MKIKEADVAISVGADKERFELVHSNTKTLFFGHNKVHLMFKIKHVPNFDNPIFASAAYKIVLIEFILIVCSLFWRIELIWRDVFEIKGAQTVIWVMTRL